MMLELKKMVTFATKRNSICVLHLLKGIDISIPLFFVSFLGIHKIGIRRRNQQT